MSSIRTFATFAKTSIKNSKCYTYPHRQQKLHILTDSRSCIALFFGFLGKVLVAMSEDQQVAIEDQVSSHKEANL